MAVKKKFPYRAAVVACNGGCRSAEGEAGCADGCIGCKACIDKCKFGAISINEYGVAEVDEEKCIGCGACAKVCPQKVIHLVKTLEEKLGTTLVISDKAQLCGALGAALFAMDMVQK